MQFTLSFRSLLLVTSLAAGLVLINAFSFKSFVIGIALFGLFLKIPSYAIGTWLFPALARITKMLLGFGILLMGIATTAGLVYFFINLSQPMALLIGLGVPGLGLYLARSSLHDGVSLDFRMPANATSIAWLRASAWPVSLVAIMLALGLSAIVILFNARTTEALRSPWHVVQPDFFVALFVFFVAAFSLLIFLIKKDSTEQRSTWLVLLGATILTLSVGLVVYAIGYGFDSFIHAATERAIFTSGSIDPKPLYYLGQYGLIVVLAHLTLLPVELIDRFLLPGLVVLFLPLGLLIPASRKNLLGLALLSLVAFSLKDFIQTTPQGIANFLFMLVAAITFWFPLDSKKSIGLTGLIVVTALVTHPLAGIPALLLFLLAWLKAKSTFLSIAVGAVAAGILPMMFLAQEWMRRNSFSPDAATVLVPSSLTNDLVYTDTRFSPILDLVYQFGFNIWIWITMGALVGLAILVKRNALRQALPHIILTAVLIFDAFILTQFIHFDYLISYERGAFADRLLALAAYAILPLCVTGLLAFWRRLVMAPLPALLISVLFFSGLATAGVYLTYPRFDTYAYDRGYSTSTADLEAVRFIDKNASGSYIVLANQAVSAAALKELGFKQTFSARDGSRESYFFYSIPTSGTLYQKYLVMIQEPSEKTMAEAMELTQVNEAYFVLNGYWFDSQVIAEKAKTTTDSWWSLADGKILVFRYRQ